MQDGVWGSLDYCPELPSSMVAGVFPGFSCSVKRYTSPTCDGVQTTVTLSLSSRVKPGGCPRCLEAGMRSSALINEGDTAGTVKCGADKCAYKIIGPMRKMIVKGGEGIIATVESLGRPCSTDAATAAAPPAPSKECDASVNVMGCADPTGPNGGGCGWFNGDYVCTGSTPPNSCVEYSSGGMACDAGSGSGGEGGGGLPTDSEGAPVEPDGQIVMGDTTINYYTSGTVAGTATGGGSVPSTVAGTGGSALGAPGRDGSTGWNGSGSGSSGGGSGGEGGVGEGELSCVEGSEDCEGIEDIGSGEGIPDTAPCYEVGVGALGALRECGVEAFETVRDAVVSSDMVELVGGLAASVPTGGSCPSATFNAFGESFDFMESGCELVDANMPVIGLCFLIGWSLVGARILMKTF